MDRCNCMQPMGYHHNPICALHGIVSPDNIIRPETRAHKSLPFLERLRQVNAARYREWSGDGVEDPLYLSNELGGEAGEVLNQVKKLVRESRGWRGSRTTVDKLADEIADCIICLDNLARGYGIDLEKATTRKFNATSEANGFEHRL